MTQKHLTLIQPSRGSCRLHEAPAQQAAPTVGPISYNGRRGRFGSAGPKTSTTSEEYNKLFNRVVFLVYSVDLANKYRDKAAAVIINEQRHNSKPKLDGTFALSIVDYSSRRSFAKLDPSAVCFNDVNYAK